MVPGSRGRCARAPDRRLLFARRSGAPDGGPVGPARRVGGPDRPEDRRSRLSDRLHRGVVRRSVARTPQAPGRDGDGNRQDPRGGRLRQAPVRGRRRHPRPVPRGPDRAGGAGRGRLHRPPPRLSLPCVAPGPRLRLRQTDHHRHLADHDRGIPRAVAGVFRSGRHRRMPPLDIRQVERRAAAFRRHPVGVDGDALRDGRGRYVPPGGRPVRARHAALLRARGADLPLRPPPGDRGGPPRALSHLQGDDRQDRRRGRLRGDPRRTRLDRDGRGHADGIRSPVRPSRQYRRRSPRAGAQVHGPGAQPRHRA